MIIGILAHGIGTGIKTTIDKMQTISMVTIGDMVDVRGGTAMGQKVRGDVDSQESLMEGEVATLVYLVFIALEVTMVMMKCMGLIEGIEDKIATPA